MCPRLSCHSTASNALMHDLQVRVPMWRHVSLSVHYLSSKLCFRAAWNNLLWTSWIEPTGIGCAIDWMLSIRKQRCKYCSEMQSDIHVCCISDITSRHFASTRRTWNRVGTSWSTSSDRIWIFMSLPHARTLGMSWWSLAVICLLFHWSWMTVAD